MKSITFVLDGEVKTVPYEDGDTILDAALKNDVEAPYSCMEGVCVACLAKVQDGKVVQGEESCLDDDEISEGKVLTCQSRVESESATINYDLA